MVLKCRAIHPYDVMSGWSLLLFLVCLLVSQPKIISFLIVCLSLASISIIPIYLATYLTCVSHFFLHFVVIVVVVQHLDSFRQISTAISCKITVLKGVLHCVSFCGCCRWECADFPVLYCVSFFSVIFEVWCSLLLYDGLYSVLCV